jgi:Xaa-Pro aminopeptidase
VIAHRHLRKTGFVVIGAVLFCSILQTFRARAEDNKTVAPAIRITPPAPVIDEKDWLAELASRRARVAQAIGSKAVLILFSAEPRVYANDVDYQFRQENNLFYLTNLRQQRATLLMMPGSPQLPEILFLPRRSARAETWTGHMYSPEEAKRISGIKEIWEADEFEPFMKAIRAHQLYRPTPANVLLSAAPPIAQIENGPFPTAESFATLFNAMTAGEGVLFLLLPRFDAESREYRQEQNYAAQWSRTANGLAIRDASPIFAEVRLRKSPLELQLLQHAIDITIEAHERAWAAAASAKWEYEIDAAVNFTFKLRNADNWGYPDIVGCGANGTTLHYQEAQAPCKPGDLLLMDIGAEYDHYTADVTRTTPVNGKFSPAQADIYQIVYDAQEAVGKTARPGGSLSDSHRAATEVIKDGLLKLGLIADRNSTQYQLWFMHGTGHWLGMNVHDVGASAKFEPGMTFTNEPGIYIRPDALDYMPPGWSEADWEKFRTAIRPAFEKYKGIGVRIEDDMVITPTGVRWMTEALPRKISEIEELIAKSRS